MIPSCFSIKIKLKDPLQYQANTTYLDGNLLKSSYIVIMREDSLKLIVLKFQ